MDDQLAILGIWTLYYCLIAVLLWFYFIAYLPGFYSAYAAILIYNIDHYYAIVGTLLVLFAFSLLPLVLCS